MLASLFKGRTLTAPVFFYLPIARANEQLQTTLSTEANWLATTTASSASNPSRRVAVYNLRSAARLAIL